MTVTPNPWIAMLTSQTLGDYRLIRDLGTGGFGVVFEAAHVTTGARFAVKVLTAMGDIGAQVDFENEGVLLKQLNPCTGVINFVDGGTHVIEVQGPGGITFPLEVRYHVLTQASGSLDELLLDPVTRGNLSWVERLRLWRSMIKALMQMHARGVAHRDLKCSNCLLHVSKNETQVRFGDLGRSRDLALPTSQPLESYLVGRGDFRFAPPEALFWQGGTAREDFLAADYYGLGSLFVELVTGQSMTSAAMGDFRAAFDIGKDDYINGRRRDLGAMNLHFRNVFGEIIAQLPKPIQADALVALSSLCHPDPDQRLLESPFSRDREARDRLAWILRRADIMIRRLDIEVRAERRREKATA